MMEMVTGIKLKYCSAAYPPPNVHLNWIYELGYNKLFKKFYISDGNLVQYFEYNLIKQMFNPLNRNWFEAEQLLNKNFKINL